jgi:hypothetical protein
MTASGTGKNTLPGKHKHATTGNEKAGVPAVPGAVHPKPPAAPENKSRRTRIREGVDSDYAEEAEDFFYGEGM